MSAARIASASRRSSLPLSQTVRKRLSRIASFVGAALVVLCARGEAQTVRGTVVDGQSGRPISRAVVVLLDGNGRRLEAVLSGAAGEYQLAAPRAGQYVLRAERVGYATITSPPLQLDAGQTLVHRLEAGGARVMLEPVRATGRARECMLRPDGSDQTAVAWQEARKALTAASLGEDGGARAYETRLYRMVLRLDDLSVEQEQRWTVPGRARIPFSATPLDRLAATGWVHQDGDSVTFHGPDAATLLSDAFLDHHCFRLRAGEGDRDGMAGLEFAPVLRRGVPDVHGILWMDRADARLRYLEYTYTGLEWDGNVQEIGGRVEFAQEAEGRWIVPRWYIRMPVYLAERRENELARMVALVEQGGEVAGTGGGGAPAVVAGTVTDTLTGQPVPGVELSVEGTGARAVTDSTGTYRLEGVPAGPGWLRVRSPARNGVALEPLRIAITPPAGGAETRTVVLPRPVDVLARACAGFSGSALVGWVYSGGRVVRLAGAEVEGRWAGAEGSGAEFRATVAADGRGVYAFCGLAPGTEVSLVATAARRRAEATLRVPRTGPAMQDIRIMTHQWTSRSRPEDQPFGPAPEEARLTGWVVDARRHGVRGATVRIGPDQPALAARDDGTFTWPALAPGEYTLVVSRPGRPDQSVPVVLGSGMRMHVTLRPDSPPAPRP